MSGRAKLNPGSLFSFSEVQSLGQRFINRFTQKKTFKKKNTRSSFSTCALLLGVQALSTPCFRVPMRRREEREGLASAGGWPERPGLAAFLAERREGSRGDLRSVCRAASLEWLHACLAAALAILNRQCPHVPAFCAAGSHLHPCSVSSLLPSAQLHCEGG